MRVDATRNLEIADELPYDRQQQADAAFRHHTQLNADQRAAFDRAVEECEQEPTTAHFFLHGPGGTGKMFYIAL